MTTHPFPPSSILFAIASACSFVGGVASFAAGHAGLGALMACNGALFLALSSYVYRSAGSRG
jgi:hypothetical protein